MNQPNNKPFISTLNSLKVTRFSKLGRPSHAIAHIEISYLPTSAPGLAWQYRRALCNLIGQVSLPRNAWRNINVAGFPILKQLETKAKFLSSRTALNIITEIYRRDALPMLNQWDT